jgi:hypothetical protein
VTVLFPAKFEEFALKSTSKFKHFELIAANSLHFGFILFTLRIVDKFALKVCVNFFCFYLEIFVFAANTFRSRWILKSN